MDLGKDRGSLQAIEEKIARVSPEDIVSIIYTSGTTGVPKGAILTQKNFVVNIAQNSNSTMFKRLKPLDLPLTHLCHLPLCHVFGRTTDYHVGALHMSHVLIFPESFEKIPETLLEVRPNVIVSIPRFYEKFHHTVLSIVARQNAMVRATFSWAVRIGKKGVEAMEQGKKLSRMAMFQVWLANALVFDKIRRLAGLDRLIFASSGGGKLEKEVCTFVRSLGIQLSEGYGLTETSPTVNLNEPEFEGINSESAGWWTNKVIGWTVDLLKNKPKGKPLFGIPFKSFKLLYFTGTLVTA